MSQQKRDPELISLDRLSTLKNRVLASVTEYETLLKSLRKSFRGSDTDQITNLQNIEKEKHKALLNRIKVFNAYMADIEKYNLPISKTRAEVYNKLNNLKAFMEEVNKNLNIDRDELHREITQVKSSLRLMGKAREYTAQRIDIIT